MRAKRRAARPSPPGGGLVASTAQDGGGHLGFTSVQREEVATRRPSFRDAASPELRIVGQNGRPVVIDQFLLVY